ncbi:YoaK family protein [Burkholderia sp. L27(2015)]|uniref:YoaK family protein n=1 Tax=Burkholderia sp. L27(2015) TaxID=1641858 RepID=UPI00131C98BA|nr:YoaK family protein [Burkholderia sp. L27(2015)]
MKNEDTLLAFIAGYVDTLGFVALFGLFTAHVTGNFVLIGAQLAGSGQGIVLKLLAFPAFIAGVALSSIVVRTVRMHALGNPSRALFLVQALLLAGFLVAGLYAAPVKDAQAISVAVCGMLGAMAMGGQNAHSRLVVHSGVPNTVMTGNVTQAVLDLLDLMLTGPDMAARDAIRARLVRTLPTIVTFGIGAILGALGYAWISFWALLLPLGLLLVLARGSGAVASA